VLLTGSDRRLLFGSLFSYSLCCVAVVGVAITTLYFIISYPVSLALQRTRSSSHSK